VIEFARNVLGMANANSTEFDEKTPNPAVIFMPEIGTYFSVILLLVGWLDVENMEWFGWFAGRVDRTKMGGTMRLGSRRTFLSDTTCPIAKLYGCDHTRPWARHTHTHTHTHTLSLSLSLSHLLCCLMIY
jgi:CTP synthase